MACPVRAERYFVTLHFLKLFCKGGTDRSRYFHHLAECSLHFIGCWFVRMRSSDAWWNEPDGNLSLWHRTVRIDDYYPEWSAVVRRVRLFADDCLIYREIHKPEDQLALQKDLDILEQWANKWGMQFNPSKCNILSISRSIPLHRFYRACKLLKFVSMVSMFLTISGGKQKNCCNGA